MKKTKKVKMPVVKKGKRWFNTITGKYVKVAYAKRLNNYFKRHPGETLYRAGGHGQYLKTKPISEHGKDIRSLAYKQRSQIIKTKTRKGKVIYYSPFYRKAKKNIEDRLNIKLPDTIDYSKLENLDYYTCDKKVFVELYRLTRNLDAIYHILTWKVGVSFTHSNMIDFWFMRNKEIYKCMMGKVKQIAYKYRLSKTQILYGRITAYFYSDLDGWEKGASFGFVLPNRRGYMIIEDQFQDKLNWYKNRLDNDAYHSIALLKIAFYIYDTVYNVDQGALSIASHRIGINRLYPTKKK